MGTPRGFVGHVPAEEFEQLIACIAVDPSEYSPLRYTMWRKGQALLETRGERTPSIYSGSVEGTCSSCGIRVAVGPRQQQLLAQIEARIECLLCATVSAAAAGVDSYAIRSLNNPEDSH